jgi:hypothetical protein
VTWATGTITKTTVTAITSTTTTGTGISTATKAGMAAHPGASTQPGTSATTTTGSMTTCRVDEALEIVIVTTVVRLVAESPDLAHRVVANPDRVHAT